MIQRIAQQHAWEEFREEAQTVQSFKDLVDIAGKYFKWLGSGGESTVFAVDRHRVVKISDDRQNMRAEYITFINSEYQYVTPDAYAHQDTWMWILVERIEPLEIGHWQAIWDYLPTFQERAEELPRKTIDNFIDGVRAIQDGLPLQQWIDQLPDKERRFFYDLADLHTDLGLKAADIRPSNMGWDDGGRLVLYDVFTQL